MDSASSITTFQAVFVNQFSIESPGTRENSRTLSVTRAMDRS